MSVETEKQETRIVPLDYFITVTIGVETSKETCSTCIYLVYKEPRIPFCIKKLREVEEYGEACEDYWSAIEFHKISTPRIKIRKKRRRSR